MSTDAKITKDLMQTLKDGEAGFAKGAEKLAADDRPELSATFRRYSTQRAEFAAELETLAAGYGDDIDEGGSVAGTLHRGWLALKDAIAGSDPEGVLDAAEQGEDHAVAEYSRALDDQEMSAGLRTVVQRQYTAIKAAHDDVRALRDIND